MPSLFDAVQVGDLRLANRIVMAPMTRNRAPQSLPTPSMAVYYAQRADPQEGAGLIVSEATAISPQAQGYSDVPGLWSGEQVRAWRAVTDAVHARQGRIVAQLWHVGRISHTSLLPDGQPPVAPSAVLANARTYIVEAAGSGSFVATSMPRALLREEIPAVIEEFRVAAANAIEAGFDGVEIHAANGYLIDQFLRSGSNRRDDEWGGPIERRVRFLREVTAAVAAEVGGGRTGLRLSPMAPTNDAADDDPQRLFEHAVQQLAPLGLAYLHIVEGQGRGDRGYQVGPKPFDYVALRQAYRDAGGHGAWIVNNGYSAQGAEQVLQEGMADLVSFGRPFIANPDLAARFRDAVPLAEPQQETFYGGGDHGYIDYPRRPAALTTSSQAG